jgi:peptide/nickel transport system permease protein
VTEVEPEAAAASLVGPLAPPSSALVAEQPRIEGRSPGRLALIRLREDRTTMVAGGVILLIILIAICAPLIALITGHGPNDQYPVTGLTPDGLPRPPSREFLLGTDDLGRDLLVRIAYGTRISLLVGVLATLLTVLIGTAVGLVAGFFGGVVDTLLARAVDVMLAIPFLLFALSLASVVSVTPLHVGPFALGPGIPIVVIVIGVFSWATVARIVRGQVLAVRHREYVEAARSLGSPSWRIILREVLPNVLPTIIVYATLLIPVSIVAEAALSYLGIGVPPPTADWGSMIAEAQNYYQQAWWFLTFPCLALVTTTLAFNIFGDGLRDAMDPKSSEYRGS